MGSDRWWAHACFGFAMEIQNRVAESGLAKPAMLWPSWLAGWEVGCLTGQKIQR